MELYYLRSRYYAPVLCRFLNTDTRVGYLNIKDQNIFAYCSNNCVAYGDDDGEDSEYKAVPDYRDWYFIIHDKHGKYIGDGKFMAHIHLYSPQHDEYAMNLDGTRHDKNRAKEIKPGTKAYKVLQHLKDKGLWPPKNHSGGDDDNTPSQPSSGNENKSSTTSNYIYKTAVVTSINAYGYAAHAQPMSNSYVPVPDRSTPRISLSSIIEAFTPGRSGNLIDNICYAY